jgi:hypothetical protein
MQGRNALGISHAAVGRAFTPDFAVNADAPSKSTNKKVVERAGVSATPVGGGRFGSPQAITGQASLLDSNAVPGTVGAAQSDAVPRTRRKRRRRKKNGIKDRIAQYASDENAHAELKLRGFEDDDARTAALIQAQGIFEVAITLLLDDQVPGELINEVKSRRLASSLSPAQQPNMQGGDEEEDNASEGRDVS